MINWYPDRFTTNLGARGFTSIDRALQARMQLPEDCYQYLSSMCLRRYCALIYFIVAYPNFVFYHVVGCRRCEGWILWAITVTSRHARPGSRPANCPHCSPDTQETLPCECAPSFVGSRHRVIPIHRCPIAVVRNQSQPITVLEHVLVLSPALSPLHLLLFRFTTETTCMSSPTAESVLPENLPPSSAGCVNRSV